MQRYFRASTARSHSRSMVKGIGMTHRSLQTQLNAEKNENQNMIKELSANKKGKKKKREEKKRKKKKKKKKEKKNQKQKNELSAPYVIEKFCFFYCIWRSFF